GGRSAGGAGDDGPEADIVVPGQDNLSFAWPYGLMSPGQLFALWARRYAAVHGLSDEDLTRALGTIAVTQRRFANANPNAMMRDRAMSWDDYRNARMISEPLRLFDLCLENDGACAFLVTSAERAPTRSTCCPRPRPSRRTGSRWASTPRASCSSCSRPPRRTGCSPAPG